MKDTKEKNHFERIISVLQNKRSVPLFSFFFFLFVLFLFPASISAFQKPPNNLGLVGYWSLDDNAGTIATDFSGNGNNGSLVNSPTWIAGKRGKALDFDGSNNYINLGDTLALSLPITFSAWVNPDNFSTIRPILVTDRAAPGVPFNHSGAWLELTAAGTVDLGYGANTACAATGRRSKTTATTVSSGRWSHVVGVIRGATDMDVYINGSDAGGSYSGSGGSLVNTTRNAGIAVSAGCTAGNTLYMDGRVDEARIYNRNLSASEVSALYGTGSAKFTTPSSTGLVGHWSMDDATSTIASDFSGNGNAGTLTNMDSNTDWVSGRRGKALDFDGSNDVVNVSTNDTLFSEDQPITISAWIYPRSGGEGSGGRIVDRSQTTSGPTFQLVGDSLRFEVDGSTNLSRNAPNVLTFGRWQHVVVTWDGSTTASNVKFYVNGNETSYSLTTSGVSLVDNSAATFRIGNDATGARTFDGVIDDVKVYNRVLSVAEVAGLYRSGQVFTNASQNTKLTNGLVGLWSFNGQDITWGSNFMRDGSGNGNNGTLGSFSRTTSIDFGVNGQALKFDGSANQITSATQFANPQTFSVSIWFKTTVASGRKLIGFETAQTGTASISYDRHLSMGTDGKIYFGWYPGGITTVASLSTLNDGQWHHAVGTHNGSNGILYIDGVYQGTNTGSPQSYSGYWRIGGYKLATWTNSSDGYFSGSLDEARIYNRTITAQEVKQLYNMGRSQ